MSKGPRHSRALTALGLIAAGVFAYLLGTRRPPLRPKGTGPQSSEPPAFDPAMVQRPPKAKLAVRTIDDFLRWVAATPAGKVQEVRDAIAAARAKAEVGSALVARLFDLPASDIGQHLLLLSVIGEMRQPAFVEPLVKFIGLPPNSIAEEQSNQRTCGACISYIDAAALLKARAVEMLAWLQTDEAFEAALGFARYHESRVVRVAALDAYTYNHQDSPDALERARAAARHNEAKLVGLPRFTREINPKEFAERVAAFYEQHPEDRPPAPHIARELDQRAPRPRSSR